jgi:hypothetical protein
MYIDLACGHCESSLALDTVDEEAVETFSFDLIHRFTKAHETCGFIAPSNQPSSNTKAVKPFNTEDTP